MDSVLPEPASSAVGDGALAARDRARGLVGGETWAPVEKPSRAAAATPSACRWCSSRESSAASRSSEEIPKPA